MKNNNRIAIVGAGVAGIALAILATKQGYQVSLYERNSNISSIGAGVTLWPNAMFVLQQMALEDEIKGLGGVPSFMRQFDKFGTQQGKLNIEDVNALSGFASVTILRRDLMNILARALDDLGVKIQFNCSMTVEDIDTLKQSFSLVVGTDGRMNSVVRHTLYPQEVKPCYQGFINIIGISQLEEGVLDNAIDDFRGPSERFGIVPVKAGLCYWAAGWSTQMDKLRPLSAWFDEMHQRFINWPVPVQNVLECYDKSSLNRIFVHDINPLPYWHKDNVLIIGDAAHAPLPTSGQGACQALEDAWHLARHLSRHFPLNFENKYELAHDLDKVLTDFYQQRIVKTSAIQAAGRTLAQTIFGGSDEPKSVVSGISAEQLSEFWMKGL